MPVPRVPVALLLVAVSLTAACSPGDAGGRARSQTVTTASCAGVIEVDGITYVPAGRPGAPVPETGAVLHGRTLPCDDGGGRVAGHPVTAHAVPGVPTTDAVAADGHQLMVAERLRNRPGTYVPRALRLYLGR